MKQRKKLRDGIGLYPPPPSETHIPHKQTSPFLLSAIQLLAVWFLAFSWWQSLTSVLPIQTDTIRLYTLCFLFTAVLVLLWNAPIRAARKGVFLILLLCLAGSYIRRHLDAAVNVLNLTANAYLTVQKPDSYPYPIQSVSEPQMALMFAIFLLPLLLIWSLILHIRKGKLFAFILLLTPAAFALIITKVPSETSCWLLLLSGAVYAAVYGCRQGRAALFAGFAAAAVLTLMILLAASVSRPLEQYKQPPDGFYARTRESIETELIKPLQDSYEQAKAERDTRRRSLQENDATPENVRETENELYPENGAEPENNPETEHALSQESSDDNLQSENDSIQTEQDQNPLDTIPETGIQPDFTAEPSEDSSDHPLFPAGNDTTDNGNTSDQKVTGNMGGHADTFPYLNALSYFQPDEGTRLTLTLDSKPEETIYYPSAYGVFYENSRWMEASASSMEIYFQYPGNLDRLKTLCQEKHPETLSDASNFIQKEFEEHTVYDFEPGPTPEGNDFAEYFLFENQRGFCVHFATTAVLMYRICGFPARYVQGYAIPPSAFHRQEDGSYTAGITGEMGHAWCEVYTLLDEVHSPEDIRSGLPLGYTSSDIVRPSLMDLNSKMPSGYENGEWIIKEHTLPYYGARPQPGIPAVSESGRSWVRNAAGWGLLILKSCAVGFVCILAFLLLFFLQAALRRQHTYRRFRTVRHGAGIQRMYCAIYDTAVFQGMKKTDILSLQGFQTLRDFFPEIPADSMEWLYQTVLETMFYEKAVTKEDTRHAWNIYRQFSRIIKKKLSLSRKFIYNYVKAL